jgi:hypothetical protein
MPRVCAGPDGRPGAIPVAAAHLTLSEEEMRRLEEPYVPHPVLGHS